MIGYKTFKNRYADEQIFVHISENKIFWFANFNFCRMSKKENSDDIIMIDPSGGPYIEIDTLPKSIIGSNGDNKIIKSLKFSKDCKYVIIKLKDKDGK